MTVLSCAECGIALKPHGNRKYDLCSRHSHAASERRRRATDPEAGRLAARARYHADVERQRQRAKDYATRNREKVAAYQRRYAEANAQAKRDYFRAYNAERREYRLQWLRENAATPAGRLRRRASGQKRRAAIRSSPGSCSPEQFQGRWDYFGGLCWMCGKEANSVDHVIPLARGGSNWPANLRPACGPCNSAKGARSWRLYLNQKEAA